MTLDNKTNSTTNTYTEKSFNVLNNLQLEFSTLNNSVINLWSQKSSM